MFVFFDVVIYVREGEFGECYFGCYVDGLFVCCFFLVEDVNIDVFGVEFDCLVNLFGVFIGEDCCGCFGEWIEDNFVVMGYIVDGVYYYLKVFYCRV